MNLLIETEDLGKRYGDVCAVEHLSLRVAEGEIYAFLGLNGAGKTTTIRMLLGMIRPTSGSASVLGTRVRPGSREPWASVGYLVEVPHAYPELSVRENLEAARRLHPGTPRESVSRAIDRLGLAEYADRRAGTLSHGNAQRLGLAKALLHDPKLIFLDEPANGLDPAGIVEIRELLLALTREQGVTVFMSSHILAEIARLAGRVGIIHNGRLLQELSAGELERNRERRLLLRVRDVEAARRVLVAAGHPAGILPDGTLELKNASALEHPEEINTLLVRSGAPPTQVLVEEEELETYFLRLVGEQENRAMHSLGDMVWVELRKALRSRMPLCTCLGSLFMPLGIAFLIFVSRNPGFSQQLGLVSAKANLVAYSATDWPAYLSLSGMVIAAGGFFFYVLAISWIFGREFTDGTLKDMLAVPVPRFSILLAKFIVFAVWAAVLSLVSVTLSLVMGAVIHLPGASAGVFVQGSALLLVTACLVILVVLPFAFFASVGRGYLLPLGVAVLLIMMANVVALAGWGEYFPWAVPGLFAQGKSALPLASFGIVLLTGLAGMLATWLWWKYADQNR